MGGVDAALGRMPSLSYARFDVDRQWELRNDRLNFPLEDWVDEDPAMFDRASAKAAGCDCFSKKVNRLPLKARR